MRLQIHRVTEITWRVIHYADYWHIEQTITSARDEAVFDLFTDYEDVAVQVARGAGVEILEGYPEGAEDDEEA